MPIGKDSIKTRVAKTAGTAAETVETPVAAEATAPAAETAPAEVKKPAPKKRTTSGTTKKKAAPQTESAPKTESAPEAEKPAEAVAEPATAVLANVAPETVEAVVGHKEDAKVEHVQVGQKMPHYLL